LNELPAFAVAHGGGRHTAKLVGTFAYGGHQPQRVGIRLQPRVGLRDIVIQTVQAFPHLRADLLANLAGILAALRDTGCDGRFVAGSLVSLSMAVCGSIEPAVSGMPSDARMRRHLSSVETFEGFSIRL
jgi:hypothetical protein